MKKVIIIVSLLFISIVFSGCTQENESILLLQTEGYEDITITGYDFLSCGEDDFYRTGFSAKKNGNDIIGAVCAGLFFKGATIRYK